jgi:DNA-binding MarR family transcriptional regulator
MVPELSLSGRPPECGEFDPMADKRILALTDAMVRPLEEQFPGEYKRDSTRAFFAIRALAQRINDEANGWLATFGLNAGSYNHLITLYSAGTDYALTQNEIRMYVHTTHASVAQMVRGLERDGLVRRTKNPRDARSVVVKLTPKGIRLMQRAAPVHHKMIEQKLRYVSTAERRQLMELLLAVNRGFEDENDERAGDGAEKLSVGRGQKVVVRAT